VKPFKVYVTDYEYSSLAIEKEVIEEAGGELIPCQCQTEEDIINQCKDADALINQYAPISRKVMEQLKNCKVISRYGVGVNTIDVPAATEHGIVVSNVTDYCIDEVSDHALSLFLSLARNVVKLNAAVKSGNWDYKVGVPMFRLRGRTLGLIGFGKIPRKLAIKAQSLGLKVIAYDPYFSEKAALEIGIRLTTLNEVCNEADFLSVHAPLTNETKGLIGREQFRVMKKGAYVINTSRGPVIDETALIEALQEGEIAGAALDVLENEPIQADNPLLEMDQVILNPHVAWYSEESQAELKRKTAENVASVLNGRTPAYIVR
jgi:D-3-phosphoglycerate dehydrogenase